MIVAAEAKRCHILCMSAVAAGLVAKSRLFGASFAGAARGISSRNALRPGGNSLAESKWQVMNAVHEISINM